ncbi:uncharacterized protein LOC6642279 [Drosophila willistoni]|uniref:uncharacterized protein LOC6642279 n=1 Tax=Drosophila willistoni TaxID=7260 RepID=UPI00017D76D2|nr:uncharacterized protein LOC6642279 [Drosophila willistoni]
MERKEVDAQQFIDHDHTLLASDLMRDPNNFIMDLIDTGVFPKSEGPTNLSTTRPNAAGGIVTSDQGNVTGDSLTPDMNFHNSIFQFVNKHVEDDVVARAPLDQGEQPAFPALVIEPTVPIDDDLLYSNAAAAHATNARKVLPHKKRISRKLKGNIESDIMEHELHHHQHQEQQQQQLKPISVGETIPTAMYSCEICGYAVHTQLDFFAHLKAHYEPPTTMQQSLHTGQEQEQLPTQQQQKEPLDMCGLSVEDKQEQAKLVQVFHDVQLNFENFHNMHHTHHVDDVDDDVGGVNMVIHGGNESAVKAPPIVSSNAVTHDVAVDDVEFSDTEDMLEGIRNVVDKVSIEDTCDELVDLELASSGMRPTWFNNNFSDIAFSGLLLPGEPPPPAPPSTQAPPQEVSTAEPPTPLPSAFQPQTTIPPTVETFEQNLNEVTKSPPPLSTCCTPPPPVAPPAPPLTHTNGSSIEQLQRSPHVLNEPLKLEDEEFLDSTPDSPYNENWEDANSIEPNEMDPIPEDDNDPASKSRRKYYCAKCVRNFNSYNALKYHQFTHNEQRTHKCGTCDRSFYTQSALNAHEKRHSDDKPFKCEHCDHRCRLWGDLKYHVISRHSDLKAHMCEFCGKNFSRRYSLVLHRRIHTSERNYACEYCDKTFRASSYLLSHIKVHTGERPHKCTVCEKTFRVSGDLKRHSRIHDPVRKAQIAVTRRLKKNTKKQSKLKQIEDEDDVVDTHNNNKSEAICCDESEQEILGL